MIMTWAYSQESVLATTRIDRQPLLRTHMLSNRCNSRGWRRLATQLLLAPVCSCSYLYEHT
jgi:hypothetical protein